MTSRRAFIQGSLAVSAYAWSGLDAMSAGFRAGACGGGAVPLHAVIVDGSTAAGKAFAAEARSRGARVCMTTGDISSLWLNDIGRRWRESPAAVAGLTAAAPLFCLELLGRDHGLRLLYRIRHSGATDGVMRHDITAPRNWPALGPALAARGAEWPVAAARLALTAALEDRGAEPIDVLDLSARRPQTGEMPLFSWVIVPDPRAPRFV